jgi:hypothetical protein
LGATILSQNNKELLMSNTIPTEPQEYLDFDGALEKIGDLPALRDLLDMFQVSLTRDIPKIESLLAQDNVFLANRMLHTRGGNRLCSTQPQTQKIADRSGAAHGLRLQTGRKRQSPWLAKLIALRIVCCVTQLIGDTTAQGRQKAAWSRRVW